MVNSLKKKDKHRANSQLVLLDIKLLNPDAKRLGQAPRLNIISRSATVTIAKPWHSLLPSCYVTRMQDYMVPVKDQLLCGHKS